mgnify:CR=1 FL=1
MDTPAPARRLTRYLGRIALIAVLLLAAFIGWRLARRDLPTAAEPLPAARPVTSSSPVAAPGDCAPPAFTAAAANNAAGIDTLAWSPFRNRPETGWRTYAPRIAAEIASDCPYDSAGFAEALSRYQAAHRLPADGRLTPETFERMRIAWDLQRPFQRAARLGCPPAPDPATLQAAAPAELYGGKPALADPGALAAYRRMAADARAAGVASDPTLLTIFSAFRDPAADAERCARQGGCGGPARAVCSAHRTGTALDLNLGHAPGARPDSTEDANRLWMSQTPLYRWLVRNAARYGFVNYAFEPWHWEWAG